MKINESGISWLSAIKVTARERIIGGEKTPLQQGSLHEVEIHEKPTYESYLLNQNREYEDLPNDMTDEGNEAEFEESDDLNDGSNDD